MKKRICLLIVLGTISCGLAQKPIDSLIDKGNFELYEHPERTIRIGVEILNSAKATQEQKLNVFLMVSTAYSSRRNYAKSLEYAVKAAQEITKIKDDGFKIIAYSRLGVQYQQLKVYNKAHDYLDKAITVANNSKQHFDLHKLLGFNYAIRGMVYKDQMSCDIALNYFNKSLYHYGKCAQKLKNYSNVSVIAYNKGNCFLSLNQIDSAQICYTSAYDNADKVGANSLKAFANKGLAEVNTTEGHYKTAIGLLRDALEMSENVGDQVLNQGIYKGLSDNYLLTGEIALHDQYHLKYDGITRQIKENNARTLNEFVLQLDREADAEISQIKSGALVYQIALSALLITMLILLWIEIQKGRKKYNLLKSEREKLEGWRNSK